MGHRAAVNVVDFDEKYIVSASGDRTIKVGLTVALFPGVEGGGGERAPGTHCLRMHQRTCGDCVCTCTYVYW